MRSTTELLSNFRTLVQRDDLACDTESGLCRFCGALIESNRPEEIEPHKKSCIWYRVRVLVGLESPRRHTHHHRDVHLLERAA